MVDTFTGTASVFGSPHIQTAFDTAVDWFLNDQVFFGTLVDKRPVAQAMPGQTVTLTIEGQLAVATTPLTELVDVDAVAAPAPRQVSVTVNEYGNAITTTHKLEKTAFSGSVIQDIGRMVADNGAESLDVIYRTQLDGGTNKLYNHISTGLTRTDPVANTGNITAKMGAAAVTQLRGRKAITRDGMNYLAYIHPDVSFDLRNEAGSAWTAAHTQVDTGEVYRGEVGTFAGCRYIETPRCLKVVAAQTVYNTYYMGREGLLEATVDPLGVRVGPMTDKFGRFRPVGWYAFFGVTRYRENCLELVKTTSSISTLAGAYDPKA